MSEEPTQLEKLASDIKSSICYVESGRNCDGCANSDFRGDSKTVCKIAEKVVVFEVSAKGHCHRYEPKF